MNSFFLTIGLTLLLVVPGFFRNGIAVEFSFRFRNSSFLLYKQKNKHTILDPENQLIKIDKENYLSNFVLSGDASFSPTLYGKYSLKLDYIKNRTDSWSAFVKEAYISYDLSDKIVVLAGRRITDWGKSYYKKPSAILDPDKKLEDLNDITSSYMGYDQVALEYYLGNTSVNLVFATRLDEYSGTENILYAGRASTFWRGWEFSLIQGYRETSGYQVGGNFTKVFGTNLEIHGEILGKQKYTRYVIENHQVTSLNKRNVGQASLGFLYSLNFRGRDVRIISEVYWNSPGYTSDEWKDYKSFITRNYYNMFNPDPRIRLLAARNYNQAVSLFNPETMGRYFFFTVIDNLPPLFNRLSVQPVALFSPEDGGGMGNINLLLSITNYLKLFGNFYYFGGKRGSIFRNIPYQIMVYGGIQLSL